MSRSDQVVKRCQETFDNLIHAVHHLNKHIPSCNKVGCQNCLIVKTNWQLADAAYKAAIKEMIG